MSEHKERSKERRIFRQQTSEPGMTAPKTRKNKPYILEKHYALPENPDTRPNSWDQFEIRSGWYSKWHYVGRYRKFEDVEKARDNLIAKRTIGFSERHTFRIRCGDQILWESPTIGE